MGGRGAGIGQTALKTRSVYRLKEPLRRFTLRKRLCPTCSSTQVLHKYELELAVGRLRWHYVLATCQACIQVLQAMIEVGEVKPHLWWGSDSPLNSLSAGP